MSPAPLRRDMADADWDPFKDLLFLQERMSRVFDDALAEYRGARSLGCAGTFPPVDIFETERDIVLRAELPGFEINDITIEVRENLITLRGERKPATAISPENYLRMERFYGVFERVFCLPHQVRGEDVRATMEDGVLEISVARLGADGAVAVRIPVD